ncbi:cell envelope integrity protein CreD [uncultured Boseongicola sp.]|jgi:inner membrane protein|uniref:cell envelope integrity protein CreD n=1 Tax=uncultured Boseongicola sp. TaxID=1648499 RepID=UPI0026134210|nr:cell envelope integrity protein CreD [uncultured Boseongicola sp.]
MFRSAGFRFIAVGLLALLMFIPLNLISSIIDDRATYARQTVTDISLEWGGAQQISGPVLIIPVTEDVTYDRRREAVDGSTGLTLQDENGKPIFERFEETVTETRPPVHLFADTLDITVDTTSERRNRGIFDVPVYTAQVEIAFDFNALSATDALGGKETLHWKDARIDVYLTSNRALRGEAQLTSDGAAMTLEPIAAVNRKSGGGLTATPGDPRGSGPYRLTLKLNGAQHIAATATGRTSHLAITSDWPDPSFFGSFLPDARSVNEDGFTATWSVPHLARPLPQLSREPLDPTARSIASMGVRFITPNDFYQKAYRSARYGILFIGLTFLTVLLLDRVGAKPAHPVQYLMIGLAQSVFVLLMASFAEQIGFAAAYLLAASATIGLLTLFGATALKLAKRTTTLAAMLIIVYAVLYLILQSADYALLAGSTLAFLALAGTMWLTRDEDWHGPDREPRKWFLKKAEKDAPSAS